MLVLSFQLFYSGLSLSHTHAHKSAHTHGQTKQHFFGIAKTLLGLLQLLAGCLIDLAEFLQHKRRFLLLLDCHGPAEAHFKKLKLLVIQCLSTCVTSYKMIQSKCCACHNIKQKVLLQSTWHCLSIWCWCYTQRLYENYNILGSVLGRSCVPLLFFCFLWNRQQNRPQCGEKPAWWWATRHL